MRFSIITCTRDSAEYLEENMHSVRNQTFKDYEHIFIDGNSLDRTNEIIAEYRKSNPSKIHTFSVAPHGISNAMNAGIRKAQGEYIIHLHSDDKFHDFDVLREVDQYLKKYHVDWIYGQEKLVDRMGLLLGFKSRGFLARQRSGFLGKIILTYFHIVRHQSVFIKKSVFERFGLFDEHIRCPMDLDMWLRIKDRTKWSHIERTVSNFMVRDDSISFSTGGMGPAFRETYVVYRKHLRFHQKVLKLLLDTLEPLSRFKLREAKWKCVSIYKIFFRQNNVS